MIKKYALVTGASSGIGLEISKILASIGFSLVLVARREEKLKGVTKTLINKYGITADYFIGDLENPNTPKTIYDFCHKKGYFISLLVNNAGYALPDTFHETSMEAEEKFLRVLGVSVIALTKLFLIDMIEAKQGKIMMISSVAAFAPPSSIQTLYGPIKTFMNRFSDGININYKHKGITSTALCPGFTTTGFHTASGVQEEMDKVPRFMVFPAERIANEGVDAMFAGKSYCVPTKTYKLLVFLLKNIPQSVFNLLGKSLAPGRYDKK